MRCIHKRTCTEKRDPFTTFFRSAIAAFIGTVCTYEFSDLKISLIMKLIDLNQSVQLVTGLASLLLPLLPFADVSVHGSNLRQIRLFVVPHFLSSSTAPYAPNAVVISCHTAIKIYRIRQAAHYFSYQAEPPRIKDVENAAGNLFFSIYGGIVVLQRFFYAA